MADSAIEFLLQNLNQLLLNHARLIKDAKNQVEMLDNDLRLFKAFLRDTSKKRRMDESLRELVRQILEVVYEAEDTIDAFVTQAVEAKSTNYFLRALKAPINLYSIAMDLDPISGKIREIYGDKSKVDFDELNIGDGEPDEPEAPIIREDNVVGFEDEAEKIIRYLKENTKQLDVISVIGMPGLGKTTLAWKIFHDKAIRDEFPTCIWVYVSQEFNKKNVLLAIMRQLTNADGMHQKTEKELEGLVYSHLRRGRFLIVMDDVGTPNDWKKIEIVLPPESNNSSKVLITSRHAGVARCANRSRDPHELRFLTDEESWLLLQYKVFGKLECHPDLEVPGKLIAGQCDGLPLAIEVIGSILVTKFCPSDDIDAMKSAWSNVSKSVSTYLNEDTEGRMEKIIAMSYDKLPYHLRACFLYLGMFPEDFEIPVWKLIRMWIAEGFIQKNDCISLEETAENYLDDLINRNLLRVDKRRSDGRVKTCHIHDMLRNFCKREGGNFLQEVKMSAHVFEPPISEVQKYRRICVHSNVLAFISSKPYGPRVRSFACFSKEDISLSPGQHSTIPAAFKLLRVLDAKPIIFSRIPSDMYQLVHLRYIALSFRASFLPAAFVKLWNVQTLVVDTTSGTLEIKADIFKMNQLRHLKTNVPASLPKPAKNSTEGEHIRTLGTIAPQSCTAEVFHRACNLRKLRIRGRLAFLLEGKTGAFDSLGRLSYLEKLKLINDVFPNAPSKGQLLRLPPPYQFPPNLKVLTLVDTFLDWGDMFILGLLENLEVLKLKDKAFMGEKWHATDGGFPHLEALHIGRTDLKIWEASGHHFPRLRRLELRNCEELHEIPLGLADIPSLQLLDLYRSNKATASAKKIRHAKIIWKEAELDRKDVEFKLSIFPLVE